MAWLLPIYEPFGTHSQGETGEEVIIAFVREYPSTCRGSIRFGWKVNNLISHVPQHINETLTIYSPLSTPKTRRPKCMRMSKRCS